MLLQAARFTPATGVTTFHTPFISCPGTPKPSSPLPGIPKPPVVMHTVAKRTLFGIPFVPIAALCIGGIVGNSYKRVTHSHQSLIKYRRKEGFVRDVSIMQSGFIWPWEEHIIVNFDPVTYNFTQVYRQNLNSEKVIITCNLTICLVDLLMNFENYIRFLDKVYEKDSPPGAIAYQLEKIVNQVIKEYCDENIHKYNEIMKMTNINDTQLLAQIRTKLDTYGLHVYGNDSKIYTRII